MNQALRCSEPTRERRNKVHLVSNWSTAAFEFDDFPHALHRIVGKNAAKPLCFAAPGLTKSQGMEARCNLDRESRAHQPVRSGFFGEIAYVEALHGKFEDFLHSGVGYAVVRVQIIPSTKSLGLALRQDGSAGVKFDATEVLGHRGEFLHE